MNELARHLAWHPPQLNRYHVFLLHNVRMIGFMFRIFAVIIGIFVMTDLLRLSSWGYPDWSIIIPVHFYVVGHFATRFARVALQWPRTRPI